SSDRGLFPAHGSRSGSGVCSHKSHQRKSRMVEISLSGSGEGPGWETSRPTLQSPFAPWVWMPQRLLPAATARWMQWGKTARGALGRDGTRGEVCNHRHGAHGASEPTRVVVALGDPVTWCL